MRIDEDVTQPVLGNLIAVLFICLSLSMDVCACVSV